VDALAAAGVYVMGEGEEQTPVAVITDLPRVEFSEVEKVNRGSPTLRIPLEEDLFEPMLSAVEWKKGKGGLTNRQLDQIKRTGRLE
jgi:F420-0:gamma-glutamyl ligase